MLSEVTKSISTFYNNSREMITNYVSSISDNLKRMAINYYSPYQDAVKRFEEYHRTFYKNIFSSYYIPKIILDLEIPETIPKDTRENTLIK